MAPHDQISESLGVPGTLRLTTSDEIIRSPEPCDDPNDPLNWPAWRKTLNFSLTLVVTVVIFTQLSIQTVFWQQLVEDLDLTYNDLNNALAINYAGTGTGCVLFIPFAIKYGRRPVYLVSTALMAAFAFWTARIESLGELFATNLLCGLAGATNETIVQMTIVDIFFTHQRSRGTAMYSLAAATGAFLTPIAAGAQAATQGWRWSYWTLAICNAVVFFVFVFFFEETKYVSHVNGTPAVQVEGLPSPADDPEHGKADIPGPKMAQSHETPILMQSTSEPGASRPTMRPWKERLRLVTVTDDNLWKVFLRPLEVLFCLPAVMFSATQYGFSLCWIAVITSVQSIYMPYEPWNFDTTKIGLLNLPPFIGLFLGNVIGGWIGDKTVVFFARRNNGVFEPEMRLYPQIFPLGIITAGFLMFGISIAQNAGWAIIAGGTLVYGFGWGLAVNTNTYTMDSYTEIVGEAFVGVSFVRNLFSIIVLLALEPWIEAQGLQNMFIVMGVLCFFFAAWFVPMIYIGKACRRKTATRYARLAREGASR